MCSLRLPTLKILFCFVFHCNGAIKSYLRKKEPRTLASRAIFLVAPEALYP